MMIKVFEKWLNPDHVIDLIRSDYAGGEDTHARTYKDCGRDGVLCTWDIKTCDEVGNEINKQIREERLKCS